MNWLDIVLIGAVVIGAACGTALVVRRPQFWGALAVEVWRAAVPEFKRIITQRMTPEQEAEWRKSTRLPDGEDAFNRKRRGAPPKG